MDFQTHLRARLRQHETESVLRKLGYAPDNRRALERLFTTVEDDNYGLGQSHFDFRYSGADFLRALCRQLDLPPESVEAEIIRVQRELTAELTAFKPYLWIDTHFTRQNQPLFALAACESQRYLPLDWQLPQQSLVHQLVTVRKLIDQHWQSTEGNLGIWGTIQAYWYFFADDQYWRFSTQGDWLDENEGPVPNRASLSI